MPSPPDAACDACLRRTFLFALLAPHVEAARHQRRLTGLLALSEDELLAAIGGDRRPRLAAQLARFDAAQARAAAAARGLALVCAHAASYPARLLEGPDAPPVLHVRGELAALPAGSSPAVAIVGARRATAYGLEVAR